jgi:hypothetical protein
MSFFGKNISSYHPSFVQSSFSKNIVQTSRKESLSSVLEQNNADETTQDHTNVSERTQNILYLQNLFKEKFMNEPVEKEKFIDDFKKESINIEAISEAMYGMI